MAQGVDEVGRRRHEDVLLGDDEARVEQRSQHWVRAGDAGEEPVGALRSRVRERGAHRISRVVPGQDSERQQDPPVRRPWLGRLEVGEANRAAGGHDAERLRAASDLVVLVVGRAVEAGGGTIDVDELSARRGLDGDRGGRGDAARVARHEVVRPERMHPRSRVERQGTSVGGGRRRHDRLAVEHLAQQRLADTLALVLGFDEEVGEAGDARAFDDAAEARSVRRRH